MKKYYFAELQNRNSFRKAEEIHAEDLQEAMKIAEESQTFEGTILKIGEGINEDGFILEPIAIKDGEEWEEI